jgi:hypothetical protein
MANRAAGWQDAIRGQGGRDDEVGRHAVIDALRVVLHEAEAREDEHSFDISTVNRWIARLPGAWLGRWRHLKVPAEYSGGSTANRDNLISHVRATLAYLENQRDNPQPGRFRRGLFPRGTQKAADAMTNIIALPGNKRLH